MGGQGKEIFCLAPLVLPGHHLKERAEKRPISVLVHRIEGTMNKAPNLQGGGGAGRIGVVVKLGTQMRSVFRPVPLCENE